MSKVGQGAWLSELEAFPLHAVLVLIKEGLHCLKLANSPQAVGYAESIVQHVTLCSLEGLIGDDSCVVQASMKGVLPACIEAASRLGPHLESWVAAAFQELAW